MQRFHWPKAIPALTSEQAVIADDFMKNWMDVFPKKYGAIARFNHTYPLRSLRDGPMRTLELGAGLGEHLAYEPLDRQDYHCIELRENMAAEIRKRYPNVSVTVGDCQKRLPFSDAHFDRAVVIHVLEHLPDLPAALDEAHRVLKPEGRFSVVLPCDPGLAYGLARKISAERIFKKRYKMPYAWFINREHINSPAEIMAVIAKHFTVEHRAFFPLRVPLVNINLCIGLTLRRLA